MKVTPISAQEAAKQASELGLFPPGDYDFEVYDASEEESSAGNEMIKLTLHVFNSEGSRRTVFDYLVSAPNSAFKIRHFAEATRTVSQYERGALMASELVQRTGRCKLRIKKGTGNYQDQNAVADYIKPNGDAPAPTSARSRSTDKTSSIDDDVIPF
ncbi:MAG: hypothetical protein KGL39_44875 [Patescibacteria group bacterium]|nr:hypothetical protein [Patescibacteria group bacterium]